MARLGDVFPLIRNGASIKQTDGAGGCPITRIETISDRTVDKNKFGYAGIENITKYKDYILQDGDILMSHINSEKHLGKIALYNKQDGEQIIHGMNLLMLRANNKVVLPAYAAFFFNSESFIRQIPNITKKSVNQASFTVTALKELSIPTPLLNEQQKVVECLGNVANFISLRKQQLAKLDELVKSRFVELFGDPVTNPMGWERCALSKFIIFLTSGSRGWSQYFSKDGEMFITIKNVKNNRITTENMQYVHAPATKEAERTRVQTDDLLISITADLGRTGVVNSDIATYGAFINQHLSLVRLNKKCVNPLYISYFLESAAGRMQFESKNQSAVKAGLNFESIKSLEVLVPPLPLQTQFAHFVQKTEQVKSAMQKSLVGLETLYKARMQKYFE